MNGIESKLTDFLKQYPTDKISIGLSGGIDSIVLLHALSKFRNQYQFTLKAIHINHSLQEKSKDWAVFCETFCQQLGIEFIAVELNDSPTEGNSIEAWARQKRYEAFENILAADQCNYLYLAHHQNDQVETFLLNLMRGSGVNGLSAMPSVRTTNHYTLIRPLLTIPRSNIEAYANHHHLKWIDDPSNDNTRFDRNFMRHEIVNKLNQRFNALNNISQSAIFCQETAQLLDQYLQNDLTSILIDEQYLDHLSLLKLDKIKQIQLIRLWIKQQNIIPPNRNKMNQFIDSIQFAKNNWQLHFNDYVLILYNDLLRLYKDIPEIPESFHIQWSGEVINLKEYDFSITKLDLHSLGIDSDKLNWQDVIIRARKANDYCRPIGRNKQNKLKIIFQEKQIPLWLRKRTPIIEYQGKIIAVGKLFGCN
ncbi:MAG: tRNA lysidine(34) synthetase TilS [Gammaproteobacteria bacterium]|nr:MAG: tRNA lysidine(34) synthetase TilS [Gammaproteobacteria bacterium]UTW41495.1 tRNA lysidine(34) synthetase TilS [bacterium SCSIO 12844]